MNTNANRMNDDLSDDDNTRPPPTPPPRRVAAVPIKSEPTEPPLEVNVALIVPIKSEPEPERLVTPLAKPPSRRTTRSSGSSSDVIDDEAIAAARFIYGKSLKGLGWFHRNGDGLDTNTYFPGSLKGLKVKDIKTNGTEGVHYFRGENGLLQSLQTYGDAHAPEDLNDFPEKRSFDIYALRDRVENDLKEMEASKKAKSSHAAEPSGAQAIPTPARKRAKKSKPASKEELINENALLKDELARNKDELARKDDELAQLRLKWEQVQKVVGAPL